MWEKSLIDLILPSKMLIYDHRLSDSRISGEIELSFNKKLEIMVENESSISSIM